MLVCVVCHHDHQDNHVDCDCDYEPCGDCGFDHAYEPSQAMKAHARTILLRAEYNVFKGTMSDSAKVALDDARRLYDSGQYKDAATRVLTSLQYSVGILSPVYTEAKRYLGL